MESKSGRDRQRVRRMAGVLLWAFTLAWSLAPAHAETADHQDEAVRLAEAERINFDIPPQPLRSALTTFAEQSGWQLFYSAEVAEGIQSPGLSGIYAPDRALKELLAGTGLAFRLTDPRTVTIEPASSTATRASSCAPTPCTSSARRRTERSPSAPSRSTATGSATRAGPTP